MKRNGNTLYWIVLAALGVFLIFGHNAALDIVCKVVAGALVLAAAAGIYDWWKTKSKSPDAIAKLLGSLIFCAIGLWTFFKTDSFVKLLNVVIGAVMIVSGALALYRGWKYGASRASMILSALAVLLGLFIACSNAATTGFVIAEGVALVYTAVPGLLAERAKWR